MSLKKPSSKDRIHECTLAEIERNGIIGLRLVNVAEAAGVSLALLHKLYGDRESMLAKVLSRAIEEFYLPEIEFIKVLTASAPVDVDINEVMNWMPMPEDGFRLRRQKLRIQIFAASEEMPELRTALGEAQKHIHNATRDLIVWVRERTGATRNVNVDALSYVIHAIATSFIVNDFNPDHPLTNNNYREFLGDALLRYLRE